MSTSTYRQLANDVERSRSGATYPQEILIANSQRLIGRKSDQGYDDPNLFLLGKSAYMRRYYSEAELEQLRVWFPVLFVGIKEGFKNCISRSRQHQGQVIPTCEAFEAFIEKVLEQERQVLLLEIYHFIFVRKINYCIVFSAFAEFCKEHSWLTGFSKIISDPLTLMVNCAMEYAMNTEVKVKQASSLSEPKS